MEKNQTLSSPQSPRELFRQMTLEAASCAKMSFCKKSLLIRYIKFERFRHAFASAEGKFQGKGMRTNGRIVHLHANVSGQYVEVHMDHGNPLLGSIPGVLHLIVDVIPYVLFCIAKHGKWNVSAAAAHKKSDG